MKSKVLNSAVFAIGLSWSMISHAAVFKIDPTNSTVAWLGKSVVGKHDGIVKIKNGTLDLEGKQDKGRFVFDMASIENLDMKEDKAKKKKLEDHLKSDDFFSVSKHPEATLVLKSLKADAKDKTQYEVTGDLTIKGSTKPITMPATIVEKDGKVEVSSKFVINRLNWDIRYNSTKFVDIKTLGDKAIKDDIEFTVNLVGQKN